MQRFFSYIRVSTAKQGEGVSLQEQQEAIERYAERSALQIVERFEERETAAKRGRPVFTRMLKLLRQGKADGVLIHKIDRSARNLKDWSDLGELIDQGIQVHFVNESVDLQSRGGRLSADIQAVIAADYIRNLREETKKGFYGRLKQGMYPLPAPIGYLDRGAGKPKELDPVKAPLVRKAFELYATGRYNLDTLGAELHALGLRNKTGGTVTRTGLSTMLNNPFYIGLIRIRATGETFAGAHHPLIPKSLFDAVQAVLQGKTNGKVQRHDFVFSRLVTCVGCGYSLIGELKKGHVYYRCHTHDCPTTCVRQEAIEGHVYRKLFALQPINSVEASYVRGLIKKLREAAHTQRGAEIQSLQLRLGAVSERLNRLTDAYLDAVLDKAAFEERKAALLQERAQLEEERAKVQGGNSLREIIAENLELAEMAYFQYGIGAPIEKRELLRKLTSNRTACGKDVEIRLAFPLDVLAERFEHSDGAPSRDIPRTWKILVQKLMKQNSAKRRSTETGLEAA